MVPFSFHFFTLHRYTVYGVVVGVSFISNYDRSFREEQLPING